MAEGVKIRQAGTRMTHGTISENQGKANLLTVGRLAQAMSQAIAVSSRARNLPFVVELYDESGVRRRFAVTGISFTGDADAPDAVTMTVTPAH